MQVSLVRLWATAHSLESTNVIIFYGWLDKMCKILLINKYYIITYIKIGEIRYFL